MQVRVFLNAELLCELKFRERNYFEDDNYELDVQNNGS